MNFNGYIDKLIIWDSLKTIEDIQAETSDDLAAYYNFNSGNDNTLYDHSGNQNHGTIYGAEWVANTNLESLTISPQSLDFGEVLLGESADLPVEFGNSGEEVIEVTDIVSGTSQLSVVPVPFSVFPGGSVPVTVTYTPTEAGEFTDTLTIFSTDTGDPDFELPVTGTAIAEPIICNISPPALDFEIVVFDSTTQSQTLSIENCGYDTLEVSFGSGVANGFALEFNGIDDYVDCGNNSSLDITGDITISAWIKSDGNYPSWERIIAKGGEPESYYLAINDAESKNMVFGREENGGTDHEVFSLTQAEANNLIHLVGVDNGTEMKLYVNGSLDNIGNSQGWIPGSTGDPLVIGRSLFYQGQSFSGQIDEVAICNYALSIEEVQNLLNRDYANIDFAGFWNFNEGEGNTVYDLSGNGNHGTIYGATWVESPFSTSVAVDWLTISETTLSIPPGETATVQVTANASGYEFGEYEGSIQLTTNDPENPSIEVPASMSVLYPIAGVAETEIDFGEVGFNSITNFELQITNGGNYNLEVNSSFSGQSSSFMVIEDNIIVQPGEMGIVQIQLSTGEDEIELAETLTLSMNDPSLSVLNVPLSATIVPDIHPIITGIDDVPADQGGRVVVTFTRSYYDDGELQARIPEGYSVEIEHGGNWLGVGTNYAYGEAQYSILVETLQDSTPEDPGLTNFRVIAAMEEGNFESESEYGYSVDNIVPDSVQITSFTLNDDFTDITLDWMNNMDEDLQDYRVNSMDYMDSASLQTEIVHSSNFNDDSLSEHHLIEYNVLASDVHGNLSSPSENKYLLNTPLLTGNNLISLPIELVTTGSQFHMNRILDTGTNVIFLIGQGVGLFNTGTMDEPNWSGNLNDISPFSGYWINTSDSLDWRISDIIQPLEDCASYPIAVGNNLMSFKWGSDDAPTLEALGGEDYATDHFNFIIGQGVGLFNTENGWSGNLNDLSFGKGYWVNIIDASLDFRWGMDGCGNPPEPSLSKSDPFADIPEEYRFVQSTEQAFYLIKDIEEVEKGDLILAYCNVQLVGSAAWSGEYTPVPVMGRDMSPQTEGFCEAGEVPSFVRKKEKGEGKQELNGDIPGWSSLGVFTLDKLTPQISVIPSEFYLAPGYPNPFNPVTTISFGVPDPIPAFPSTGEGEKNRSEIRLQIYDITGRTVETLIDGVVEPGKHSVEWNAGGLPSGVYLIKLTAGEFAQSQKLLLLK